MQNVTGFWDMILQYIGGNVLYLFALLGSLIFIYQQRKQQRRVMLIAALLLLITVLNPWSYGVLVNLTGQVKTYYRFFWAIPWEMAAAYFVYEGIWHIKNLKYKLTIVLGICIGFLILNTSLEEWQLPENSYQLSYDILEVAGELKELREKNGQEKITILADANISNVIRQYDAAICFPFTSYHAGRPKSIAGDAAAIMEMLMNNQADLEAATVSETLSANDVDYLVIHVDNAVSLSYMQRLHWQIVAATSYYNILQYQEPVFYPEALSNAGLTLECFAGNPGFLQEGLLLSAGCKNAGIYEYAL